MLAALARTNLESFTGYIVTYMLLCVAIEANTALEPAQLTMHGFCGAQQLDNQQDR